MRVFVLCGCESKIVMLETVNRSGTKKGSNFRNWCGMLLACTDCNSLVEKWLHILWKCITRRMKLQKINTPTYSNMLDIMSGQNNCPNIYFRQTGPHCQNDLSVKRFPAGRSSDFQRLTWLLLQRPSAILLTFPLCFHSSLNTYCSPQSKLFLIG